MPKATFHHSPSRTIFSLWAVLAAGCLVVSAETVAVTSDIDPKLMIYLRARTENDLTGRGLLKLIKDTNVQLPARSKDLFVTLVRADISPAAIADLDQILAGGEPAAAVPSPAAVPAPLDGREPAGERFATAGQSPQPDQALIHNTRALVQDMMNHERQNRMAEIQGARRAKLLGQAADIDTKATKAAQAKPEGGRDIPGPGSNARQAAQIKQVAQTRTADPELTGLARTLLKDPANPNENDLALFEAKYTAAETAGDTQMSTNAVTTKRDPSFKLWFFAGAKLQNPYTIGIDTNHVGTLNKDNTTTDGYVEAMVSLRYITRTRIPDTEVQNGWLNPLLFDIPALCLKGASLPDFEARFGYIFSGQSSPTNYSASTVVGGSDLYGEMSVGLPVHRYTTDDKLTHVQTAIELSGGFVTDKHFLTVHPTAFAGLSIQLSDQLSNGLPWYWLSRVGVARTDTPKLVSGGPMVDLDGLDIPRFNTTWAPTMGTSLIYPLSETFSLQIGGSAYFTEAPASWNISVGFTLDPTAFFPKN